MRNHPGGGRDSPELASGGSEAELLGTILAKEPIRWSSPKLRRGLRVAQHEPCDSYCFLNYSHTDEGLDV